MTTLTEFLLARIAEDEAVWREARKWSDRDWNVGTPKEDRESCVFADYAEPLVYSFTAGAPGQAVTEHIARWDPARVRAECEAKREIVERAAISLANGCGACGGVSYGGDIVMHEDDCNGDGEYIIAEGVLRALALPYADHPDFRDEWRP